MATPTTRNLGFELVRTTEAAALAAGRWMGRGDKNAVDGAAVTAMRYALSHVDMDGIVVIGEGEKDQAPMLYIGERIGNGLPPMVDVAVDPVDGTRALAKGLPNAISVVALSERGSLYSPGHVAYVEKIAVGPSAKGAIDLTATVGQNLRAIARAKDSAVDDLTVVILDRPRHEKLINEVRAAGARVKLIQDGDVAGVIMTALPDTGIDVLMGIGGSPEAVVAACALRCLGGEIQCRLWPRDNAEREQAELDGLDLGRILTTRDLAAGEDVFFAATGISEGEVLKGVRYYSHGARTQSIVMRSYSGTIRMVEAEHNFEKLQKITELYGER
ncbi:MAG: class II fructose-bisphosphatase [Chloroflexota bacterium]|nr:class II fructose-bisphosphatase [Chloroflexota bacterium]